jgi:transcription initiation factor TFIIB
MCSPQRGENSMNDDGEEEMHKTFNPEPISEVEPVKVQCCPECGGKRLMRDYECAEIVCMDCGFVIAAKIADRGPEWRAFDNEQRAKRTRVGAPLTYTIHDKGLSTIIDWRDRDGHGKNLSYGQKAQMYRLRKWHRRVRVSDATERNLTFALSEMSKIGNNLNLPKNILETASVIYRKAVKERLIRGRSIQGVTAAAIYLACRQCKLARTLEEIAQASNMNRKEVGHQYRFLIRKLDYSVPLVEPSRYIAKFSNQLKMQGKAEEVAHKILAAAKELKLTSGRGPAGMAAAASYIASVLSGERMTQREVAEIAEVTEVTIRNRYKELVERLMFQISL